MLGYTKIINSSILKFVSAGKVPSSSLFANYSSGTIYLFNISFFMTFTALFNSPFKFSLRRFKRFCRPSFTPLEMLESIRSWRDLEPRFSFSGARWVQHHGLWSCRLCICRHISKYHSRRAETWNEPSSNKLLKAILLSENGVALQIGLIEQ